MEPVSHNMKSIIKSLKTILTHTVKSTFQVEEEVSILPISNNPKAEYNTPIAIKLFNNNKSKGSFGFKSAADIANSLKSKIPADSLIDNIEVNEKGFMAISIKNAFIEAEINNILRYGINFKEDNKLTIVVDFSSPNIAKEMHVGHLRSTIIGESLCRTLEFMGHNVKRVNHLGDWGTQFGMLIAHMEEAYPDYKVNLPVLSDLQTFYKAAKIKFEGNEEFKKKAQLTVVKLQSGDPDCLKAWQVICELSRIEFNKIYSRLQITVEEFGESFYNKMIPPIIKELEERGIVVVDQGAKCIFIPGKKLPLMVVKSDGGFNYDSTDLAAAKYRLLELKADRVIYITDSGQEPHFNLIIEGAKLIGWHQPPKTRMEHMGFGVVLREDGQKFKSSEGDAIRLVELLDEAKKRALDQLKSRAGDNVEGAQTNLMEEELESAAEKIGMAAIKYFDLKQNRISTYKFNFNQMLDPKGNTAVYLLYSYARINSILKKSGLNEIDLNNLINTGGWKITHPHERLLALTLLKFPETLEAATEELAINRICDFIYDVSVKIAEGYNKYRILDDPNTDSRILLCEGIRRLLFQAFYLVGISPLNKI